MKQLLQNLILILVIGLTPACVMTQHHVFDLDSVYRVGPKGGKVDAVFWNGTSWESCGTLNVPAGTYFKARLEIQED